MRSVRLVVAVVAVAASSLVEGGCTDAPGSPGPDLTVAATDALVAYQDLAAPADLATPAALDLVTAPAAGCDAGASSTTLVVLSPQAVKAKLEATDPVLIKVHLASVEKIPGTDAVLDPANVDAIEAFLGHDHCADVVVYCMSGKTSEGVGKALVARGYLRVQNLAGGLIAWKAAGYPVQM